MFFVRLSSVFLVFSSFFHIVVVVVVSMFSVFPVSSVDVPLFQQICSAFVSSLFSCVFVFVRLFCFGFPHSMFSEFSLWFSF